MRRSSSAELLIALAVERGATGTGETVALGAGVGADGVGGEVDGGEAATATAPNAELIKDIAIAHSQYRRRPKSSIAARVLIALFPSLLSRGFDLVMVILRGSVAIQHGFGFEQSAQHRKNGIRGAGLFPLLPPSHLAVQHIDKVPRLL